MNIRSPLILMLLLATGLFAPTLPATTATEGELIDEEPVMPEEAFALSAYMINDTTLRAEWNIRQDYYMYRKQFRFSTDTPGVSLDTAAAKFPNGKIKEDEFLGRVETYRKHVAIDIPVKRDGNVTDFQLQTVSRGCWDGGVCYPDQKVTVKVNFPSLPPAPAAKPLLEPAPEASDAFANLKSFGAALGLNTGDDDFLQVDQAFAYSNTVIDGNHIEVRWEIADGYYLYRDKFKFSLKDADGIEIGAIDMPRGKEKVDESFGRQEVYVKEARFVLPLNRTRLEQTPVTLVAGYQGCAEKGLCYPPQTREHPLVLPAGQATAGDAALVANELPMSEQDEIAATLASGNFLLNILTFFGLGLLLTFTPCVFPMIPILSSIIVGHGPEITTRKAFTMSLVYVLAMALTYTAAGIVAGLFGENLQAAFQNPWILGSFAGVFVLLSLSMFGFYELQMPSFIQSRLTEISNRQKGGTLAGVAVMGFLSALIVGPCVAAPLAGALIYIGQTGDPWLGGAALFALSMGMGAPLLVIGTSAGKLLPRAGAWMDTIKAVFGVLLLAVAVWMLERILPGAVTLVLWAALLIVPAIYMGALEPLPEGAGGWRKLVKGGGLLMLIYGVLMLIGAATGGSDPLQPLHKLRLGAAVTTPAGGGVAEAGHLPFQRIKTTADLDRVLATAGTEGKLVMLDFYADWCVSCKEMEKYTFSEPGVRAALQDMILLQADVTANDEADKALLRRFKLVGPPSIMFFDKSGQEIRQLRLVGFLEAKEFLKRVKAAKGRV